MSLYVESWGGTGRMVTPSGPWDVMDVLGIGRGQDRDVALDAVDVVDRDAGGRERPVKVRDLVLRLIIAVAVALDHQRGS